jgi:homoserine trans-succinylase
MIARRIRLAQRLTRQVENPLFQGLDDAKVRLGISRGLDISREEIEENVRAAKLFESREVGVDLLESAFARAAGIAFGAFRQP